MIHEASALLTRPREKAKINVRQCRHGLMCYFPHDLFIGGALERYGEYNHAELEILQKLCNQGDVVIEIGSNIGCHTVPLAQHIGDSGMLFAFEPQRVLYQMLCGNLAMNGLWNVHPKPLGIGEMHCMMNVPAIDYAKPGNFGRISLNDNGGEVAEVITLDEYNWPRIDLLKIDVEGMEKDVLAGAEKTIKRLRPVIYIENDRKDKEQELISHIRNLGYDMWWSLTPLFNPDNYTKNPVNDYQNYFSFDMLCIPKEREAKWDLPKIEDKELVTS